MAPHSDAWTKAPRAGRGVAMATIGSGAWSQGAITDGDEPGLVPLMVERATEDVGVTPFDIQMQKGKRGYEWSGRAGW